MPAGRSSRPIITLLTDFGVKDGYVGTMKGVIASLAPDALVVDICHEVPPQDIARGGFIWAAAIPYFPRGTVHVGVVDPGVGSRRKILAVEGKGCVFLAPDNGMVGYVLPRSEMKRAISVERREHFLATPSATFHGRDVFAPVAARIATGLHLEKLGPSCRRFSMAAMPRPRSRRARWGGRSAIEERGQIVYVDSFGNAITNLRPRRGSHLLSLEARDLRLRGISAAYQDVAPRSALVVAGSTGHLEIAVNRGRADRELGLAVGDEVVAFWGT